MHTRPRYRLSGTVASWMPLTVKSKMDSGFSGAGSGAGSAAVANRAATPLSPAACVDMASATLEQDVTDVQDAHAETTGAATPTNEKRRNVVSGWQCGCRANEWGVTRTVRHKNRHVNQYL